MHSILLSSAKKCCAQQSRAFQLTQPSRTITTGAGTETMALNCTQVLMLIKKAAVVITKRISNSLKQVSPTCWPCISIYWMSHGSPYSSSSSAALPHLHMFTAHQAGLHLYAEKVFFRNLLFYALFLQVSNWGMNRLNCKIITSTPSKAVSIYTTNLSQRRCKQLAQRTDTGHSGLTHFI